MSNKLKLTHLVALLAVLCVTSVQAKHFKVFLMGGQSNMFGYGTAPTSLPTELQGPQQDVRFYYGTNYTFLQPGSGGTWGAEITFGRTIADAFPDENFYFIKHSDGGTSLWNEWNLTDGRSYNLFKEVVHFGLDALTRAGHTYEIVGMLWVQGERDAWNLRTTAQYEADFKAFIKDIRSRYGADLPFLFSRLSLKQTARPVEAVRLAQELVAASDPHVHMIDADDFGILKDNLHYTAQGYIDMGKDFAWAYLNSLSDEIDPTATNDQVDKRSTGAKGDGKQSSTATAQIIDGSLITATASAPSMSNVAFNFNNGTQAWHPYRTIDGTGLSSNEHDSANHTGWLTKKERIQGVSPDVADSYIQWDLGASYPLESIRIWNMNRNGDTGAGIRSVDVYLSNLEFPGDPEGVGAENWIKLGDSSLEFPQAPTSGNTGFDLETATSTTLPTTAVRTIRFELNTNWNDDNNFTGLSEIQFTAASTSTKSTTTATSIIHPEPIAAADVTAPTIDFHSPRPAATGVNPGANLILIFDKPIAFGSGTIQLRKSDGTLVHRYDVANPGDGLTLSKKTLTINPSTALDDSTTYSIEIDSTAIEDLAGNPFAGISGENAWSFTTIVPDVTAPDIASTSPAKGADFFPADNLFVTFDEWIGFGTGFIHIRKSDGTLVESFDVAPPGSGISYLADTVTINPTNDLPLGSGFYVEIENTAIKDHAGNDFPGTDGKSTWSFATPETAEYATITYVDTQFDIESTDNDPKVGWRNTTPAKPLDIDGDNILGTDGWLVGTTGNSQSDPPYAKSKKTAPNGNAHGRWDNPLDPAGDDTNQGVLHDGNAGAGETSAPLVTFTITEDLPKDTTLRLGLLFDVKGGPNTATYTITQTFGGTASATTPELEWTGKSLDVAFFDLKNLRAGYTFAVTSTTISTKNYPHDFEQLVGITFDTGGDASIGKKSE